MANVLNMSGGGKDPVIQSKSVKSTESRQTVTAPSGVDGYSPITVEPIKLQAKTVTPKRTNENTIVTADSGKDGLSYVIVEGVPLQSKSIYPPLSNSELLLADSGYAGFDSIEVHGCRILIDNYVYKDSIGNLKIACENASKLYALHAVVPYVGNTGRPAAGEDDVIVEMVISPFWGPGIPFIRTLGSSSSGANQPYNGNYSFENGYLVISPNYQNYQFSNDYFSIFAIVA
mgnify:CR=1 FL=1